MLTAVAAKNAPPKDKDYKLADSEGLYLFVTTKGYKSWRYKYRFGGKEKRLILGRFPAMSLAEARDARDEARRVVRDGKDPILVQQRQKLLRATPSGLTFERFAREWHALHKVRWKPVHADDVIHSLERDVFPALGAHNMDEIDAKMVRAVLDAVTVRGAVETAHRLRQRISQIFKYGMVIAEETITRDPAGNLGIVMPAVPPSKRRPALLNIPDLQELLRVVEDAGASPITKCASRFLALTAQRPGMVRRMLWSHLENIDWGDDTIVHQNAIWHIPAEEMKLEFDHRQDKANDHLVPLAPQAVEILQAIRPLTGNSAYVFPSARSLREPMSENAIAYLYNREGYKNRHCPHGWRSAFSTIRNELAAEVFKTDEGKLFERLIVDRMLAHRPKELSETEFDYNRAAFMDRRREIAGEWADQLLDGLPPASALLDGPRRRYTE